MRRGIGRKSGGCRKAFGYRQRRRGDILLWREAVTCSRPHTIFESENWKMKATRKVPRISRREFVKIASGALGTSAALACTPLFLHADDKAAARPDFRERPTYLRGYPRLGTSARRDAVRQHAHGAGRFARTDFDSSSKRRARFGVHFRSRREVHEVVGSRVARGVHGMQLRKEGNDEFLYLATNKQHQVAKTTLDGEKVFVLDYPKDAEDAASDRCYKNQQKYLPTNIAFAPNGDFYVADGYGSISSIATIKTANTFPPLAARAPMSAPAGAARHLVRRPRAEADDFGCRP